MNTALFAVAAGSVDQRLWLAMGWTMVHFLWVGTVIWLSAWGLRLLLRWSGPQARYVASIVALLALAAAPVDLFRRQLEQVSAPPAKVSTDAVSAPVPTIPSPTIPSQTMPVPTMTSGMAIDLVGSPLAPTRSISAPDAVYAEAYAWLTRAAEFAPWIWLTGAPLMFVLLGCGLVGAERLRRRSRSLATGELNEVCRRLSAALRIARPVAIAVSQRAIAPMLVGVLRPLILLPAAMLDGQSAGQIEMILLHELAHVRRWDNLVNLVQRIIEAALFFHPAVWLVSRWVRLEREHCCDDVVLAHGNDPRAYAQTLAALAIPGLAPAHAAAVMANHQLLARVRHILDLEDRSMTFSVKFITALGSLLVTAALLVAARAQSNAADLNPDAKSADASTTSDSNDALQVLGAEPIRADMALDDASIEITMRKRPWSAEQAIGPPDSTMGVDAPTAWASLSPDGQGEWLELSYAEPVDTVAVLVYENLAPGALTQVVVQSADQPGLNFTWTGADPTKTTQHSGISVVSLGLPMKTQRIKLTVDSPNVPNWNEIDAVGLLDRQGQVHWATSAQASSTYADQADQAPVVQSDLLFIDNFSAAEPPVNQPWSAAQTTGAPDASIGADDGNAWASQDPDGQEEWLKLVYATPVRAVAILIYESFNPGAVRDVVCYDSAGKEFAVLTGRKPEAATNSGIFSVPLSDQREVAAVKLTLDSKAVPGWNEIDAVGILDAQGKVHWAKAATASSSYGAPTADWNTQRNGFLQIHRSNCLSCHSNAHQSGGSPKTRENSIEGLFRKRPYRADELDAEDNDQEPFTLRHPNVNSYWDITLAEALRTALANAKVLRNLGGRLVKPNLLESINRGLTLADFEAGVRNFTADLERAYWDLHYNYRNVIAVKAGRDSALRIWRKVYALHVTGTKGGEGENEAQAREQYFLFRAQVQNSLGLLYTAESRLRYMMGLAPTDGRLIRPKTEPTTAEVKFDLSEILQDGVFQDGDLELTRLTANSIRDLDRNYQVSVTTFNRRVAATRQVKAVEAAVDVGAATLDMLLDAQRRLADAEIAYHRALVDYNLAIMQVHIRKNSLLEHHGIELVEPPTQRGQSTNPRPDPNAIVRQS